MKHRKLRRTLANPLVIIAPIVAILLLGWNQYVQSGRDLNVSAQNMLPGGAFDDFDKQDQPLDWSATKSGALDYKISSGKGYVKGKLLNLQISKYSDGNLDLTSAKITVNTGTTYLYKGYYHTTVGFDLLVRYYYADGSNRLRFIRNYPGKSDPWSTDSVAFQSGSNIKAVQFVYRLAATGTLQLDDTYLEPDANGVYIPQTLRDTNILIPNGKLTQTFTDTPIGWSTYHTGKNLASFTYVRTPEPYISTKISGYKTGESKWQYAPQAVSAGQTFTFGVSYRSTAPSKVIVEYVLDNGKYAFDTLATLTPAGEWTRYQTQLEAPTHARSMFVSVILQSDGRLDTDDYALRNSSRPGSRQFQKPLISITFDDGWKSINQNALPILDKYGYRGTFYLNPSALDTTNFISYEQAKNLAKNGEEVGSHGFSHVDLTSIDPGQLDYQLREANNYMHRNLGGKKLNFAAPYGKSDAEVEYYARQYYRSLRTTDSGINTRQNFDPYSLKVLYISSTTTDQEILKVLKDAKDYHGWVIFVYHRVQSAAPKVIAAGENTVVTPINFSDQMQLIQKSGIAVKTVEDALDTLESQ